MIKTFKSIRPFSPKERKVTQFEVCFDNDGCLKRHSDYKSWGQPSPIKEPNAIFRDRLEYDGHFRAGGSSHIWFKSSASGRRLHMFITDFDEIIRAGLFHGQSVEGHFCFTKKGQSQGVRYFFGDLP